jgi:hypothetical protein
MVHIYNAWMRCRLVLVGQDSDSCSPSNNMDDKAWERWCSFSKKHAPPGFHVQLLGSGDGMQSSPFSPHPPLWGCWLERGAGQMENPAVSNIRETDMLSTQRRELVSRMFEESMKDQLPLVPFTNWDWGKPLYSYGWENTRSHPVLEIKDEDDDEFDDDQSVHHSSLGSAWNYKRSTRSTVERMKTWTPHRQWCRTPRTKWRLILTYLLEG